MNPTSSPNPSDPGALAHRAGVTVDDESRHVALRVEGTEFVFSAAARDVTTSIQLLQRLASAAHFAAAALEQCRQELQAQQLAWEQVQKHYPRCRLCSRPIERSHTACTWCGNPVTQSLPADSS